LISLREPFVGISVPGKLYGIMASGRPALFVGPRACESAETILEARCGAVVDPAEGRGGERAAQLIRQWSQTGTATSMHAILGRTAFQTYYEREPNCRRFTQIVESAWSQTSGSDSDPAESNARNGESAFVSTI
jgi:hypothetical protein